MVEMAAAGGGAADRERYREGGACWDGGAGWLAPAGLGCWSRVRSRIAQAPWGGTWGMRGSGWETSDGRNGRHQISLHINPRKKSCSLVVFCASTP